MSHLSRKTDISRGIRSSIESSMRRLKRTARIGGILRGELLISLSMQLGSLRMCAIAHKLNTYQRQNPKPSPPEAHENATVPLTMHAIQNGGLLRRLLLDRFRVVNKPWADSEICGSMFNCFALHFLHFCSKCFCLFPRCSMSMFSLPLFRFLLVMRACVPCSHATLASCQVPPFQVQ